MRSGEARELPRPRMYGEGGPAVGERLNNEVWGAEDLLERLERRHKFFVLDVRNRDEFERFRLEGPGPVSAVNIPSFEMRDGPG